MGHLALVLVMVRGGWEEGEGEEKNLHLLQFCKKAAHSHQEVKVGVRSGFPKQIYWV